MLYKAHCSSKEPYSFFFSWQWILDKAIRDTISLPSLHQVNLQSFLLSTFGKSWRFSAEAVASCRADKNESDWINYTALCQWIFIKFHQGTTNSERHHAGSNFNKSALTECAIRRVPWEFDFPTMGLIRSNYETGSFCEVAETGARSVGNLKTQLVTL